MLLIDTSIREWPKVIRFPETEMEEREIFEKWYKNIFHNGRNMNFHIAKFHLVPETMTRTRTHSYVKDEEVILKSVLFFYIPHKCVNMHYLFFSFWYFSLCIVSRSIHISENGTVLFLFMTELYFTVYMYHIFFIHSFVDGQLGCFHVLAIVDRPAMK